MIPFIKTWALMALEKVIEAEPAIAGEVITWLESKAGPQMEQYALTKIPALLAKVQAAVSGAQSQQQQQLPLPTNVVPLAGPTPSAPGSTSSPAGSASGASPQDAAPAPAVKAPAAGTPDQPRRGGS